jgi:hypothetical protein
MGFMMILLFICSPFWAELVISASHLAGGGSHRLAAAISVVQ